MERKVQSENSDTTSRANGEVCKNTKQYRTPSTRTLRALSLSAEKQTFVEPQQPIAKEAIHPGVAWQEYANCVDSDPEVFFPFATEKEGIEEAKKICANCKVRFSCLEHALTNNEQFGIWGGATEEERRAIKRRGRDAVVRYLDKLQEE